MTTYEFEISIKATSHDEAVSKLKSVSVVLAKLNTKELAKLADIVQNDPVKTALAKKHLAFNMKAAVTPYHPETAQQVAQPVMVQQKDESGIKEIVIYGSIGLLVAGGAIWLGRKFIQNLLSNNEERKAIDEDSAAAFAKRIKMAFDNDGWPGTDKSMLREAMRQIPSKTVFQQVVSSYQKLYNDSLLKNLSDELTSTEYNEMMQIVAGKPDKITKGAKAPLNYSAWARRLKAAFDKTYGFIPGTDEAAIKAVFLEMPTHDAFIQTGKAYSREYGKNIIDELKSELSSSDYTGLDANHCAKNLKDEIYEDAS